MRNSFAQLFRKYSPAVVKVLFSQFGSASVLGSGVLLAGALGLFWVTGVILMQGVGPGIAVPALLLQVALFWRLNGLDAVGQLLCAWGVVQENLSHVVKARVCFRTAATLLKSRRRAYDGLYRIAETREAMRDLSRLIHAKEGILSGTLAQLSARCLREAGDTEAARHDFELADRLAPSDSVKLELAEICLTNRSPSRCLEVLEKMERPDHNGRYFFFRTVALRLLGRLEEALLAANCATQVRPCDPDCQVEKGIVLAELGRHQGASHQYSKAIRVHPRHAEAHFRRALLDLQRGDRVTAKQDLERCYYYENTRTEAYLLAVAAEDSSVHGISACEPRPVDHWLQLGKTEYDLVKGDSASVEVTVQVESAVRKCRLVALEPFGGGLEVKPREVALEAGREHKLIFHVKAKRADEVNLNKPWVLNIVLAAEQHWASRLIYFRVRDSAEGKIYWVLTNDHEPRPHQAEVQADGKLIMRPERFERDLIQKSELAIRLAEKYGIKWSHLLDAGGAVSLLQWSGSQHDAWDQLWNKARVHYRDAFARGHDCQLHLHLSAMPESDFFSYGYDREAEKVFFDSQRRNAVTPGARVRSWANLTLNYGRKRSVRSRTGSLAHAKRKVSAVLEKDFPAYRPVVFRSGQWDMGATVAEREKSILALRENGILADSSATEGYDCYEKPFRFGAPPLRAVYFTYRNNPERQARSLVDAGMLEVVPITLPQGRHAMTPRDDPKAVVEAYRGFSNNGRVKPGRHMIMEIEHLTTVKDTLNGESGRETNGDWKSMERHFATVRRECPRMEGIGATEAIHAWLDYYSPELVVRLATPEIQPNTTFGASQRFPLQFLGDGILTGDERPYRLAVPLPALNTTGVQAVRILEGDKVVSRLTEWKRDWVWVDLLLSEGNQRQFAVEVENKRDLCDSVPQRVETPRLRSDSAASLNPK